jgi:OOP family OmpA-OmpF porin
MTTIAIGAFVSVGCTKMVTFSGGTSLAPSVVTPAKAEVSPKRAKIANGHIEIDEKVQFAVNSDQLLSVSDPLLNDVAEAFKENPQIKKVEIRGHASSEGDAKRNKTLSDLRAKAVMAALTAKGVEPSRMIAKGYGIEKPIADNSTEDGREKNRRVEFLIVDPPQSAQAASNK